MDHERRIAELEDELKQQKTRVAELTEERDNQAILIAEQGEHVDDVLELIDTWKDAFDMTENEKGDLVWGASTAQKYEELWDKYAALRTQWNKLVPDFNAVVAPKRRNFGRPLGASPAQRADVLKRRKAGQSLRLIAEATGLGFQTVRTIIDKVDGVDRATMSRLARMAPEKMREAREMAQRKSRAVLPGKIRVLSEKGQELRKTAKGLH